MNIIFIQITLIGLFLAFSFGIFKRSSLQSPSKTKNISRSVFARQTECKILQYPISNVTFIFWFAEIFAHVYLLVKYGQPEFFNESIKTFFYQNVAVLTFSVVGFAMYGFIRKFKFQFDNEKFGSVILVAGLGIVAIAFFQIAVIRLTKASISDIDLYIFFGSIAIGEELLFRLGLQYGLEKFLSNRIFNKIKQCGILSTILAITISSGLFGLYHWFVKDDIALVLAVMGTGVILGIIFRITKRIDSPIIAHFFVNLIVTWADLQGLSFGLSL